MNIKRINQSPVTKLITNLIIEKAGPKYPKTEKIVSKNPFLVSAAAALAIEAAALVKRSDKNQS